MPAENNHEPIQPGFASMFAAVAAIADAEAAAGDDDPTAQGPDFGVLYDAQFKELKMENEHLRTRLKRTLEIEALLRENLDLHRKSLAHFESLIAENNRLVERNKKLEAVIVTMSETCDRLTRK